jgi:hypothetical protein
VQAGAHFSHRRGRRKVDHGLHREAILRMSAGNV